MSMSRIEVTAILKSCAEGGIAVDQWRACVAIADGILDSYGGKLHAASAAPPETMPTKTDETNSRETGGTTTLTIKGPIEQKGAATRVNADGYPGGQWFSCFPPHSDKVKTAGVGDQIKCTIVEKPNPNGGRPYLNLVGVSVIPADIPF